MEISKKYFCTYDLLRKLSFLTAQEPPWQSHFDHQLHCWDRILFTAGLTPSTLTHKISLPAQPTFPTAESQTPLSPLSNFCTVQEQSNSPSWCLRGGISGRAVTPSQTYACQSRGSSSWVPGSRWVPAGSPSPGRATAPGALCCAKRRHHFPASCPGLPPPRAQPAAPRAAAQPALNGFLNRFYGGKRSSILREAREAETPFRITQEAWENENTFPHLSAVF